MKELFLDVERSKPNASFQTKESEETILEEKKPRVSPEVFRDYYDQMKKYIAEGRINEAVVLYNQIRGMAISFVEAERWEVLARSIPKPQFKYFVDDTMLSQWVTNVYSKNTYVKIRGFFLKGGGKKWFFQAKDLKGQSHLLEVRFEKAERFLSKKKPYILLAKKIGMNKEVPIVEALVLKKDLE